jgi:hypothetical protein
MAACFRVPSNSLFMNQDYHSATQAAGLWQRLFVCSSVCVCVWGGGGGELLDARALQMAEM